MSTDKTYFDKIKTLLLNNKLMVVIIFSAIAFTGISTFKDAFANIFFKEKKSITPKENKSTRVIKEIKEISLSGGLSNEQKSKLISLTLKKNIDQISNSDIQKIINYTGSLELIKLDFRGMKLSNVTFDEANLQQAIFNGVDLDSIVFKKCNLEGSDFSNTNIENTKFIHSNLSVSSFGNSIIKNSKFIDVSAKQSSFNKSVITFTELRGGSFNKASFILSKIKSCTLSNVYMTEAKFMDSILESSWLRADFSKSDMRNVDFKKSAFAIVFPPGSKAILSNFTVRAVGEINPIKDIPEIEFNLHKNERKKNGITLGPTRAIFKETNLKNAKSPEGKRLSADFENGMTYETTWINETTSRLNYAPIKAVNPVLQNQKKSKENKTQ